MTELIADEGNVEALRDQERRVGVAKVVETEPRLTVIVKPAFRAAKAGLSATGFEPVRSLSTLPPDRWLPLTPSYAG